MWIRTATVVGGVQEARARSFIVGLIEHALGRLAPHRTRGVTRNTHRYTFESSPQHSYHNKQTFQRVASTSYEGGQLGYSDHRMFIFQNLPKDKAPKNFLSKNLVF